MLKFEAPRFLEVSKEIGRIASITNNTSREFIIDKDAKNNYVTHYSDLAPSLSDFGLAMCLRQVYRIITAYDSEEVLSSQIRVLLQELHNGLLDEMSDRMMLSLTEKEESYFYPFKPLFGNEIENELPALSEDISEAGKCFGVGRDSLRVPSCAGDGGGSAEVWRQT